METEKYGYLALRNICFQVLSLILLLTYVKDESDLLLYTWTTVAGGAGNLACRPGDLSGLLLFGEKVGPPLAQREKAGQQPAGLSLCLLGLPSYFS